MQIVGLPEPDNTRSTHRTPSKTKRVYRVLPTTAAKPAVSLACLKTAGHENGRRPDRPGQIVNPQPLEGGL